MAAPMIRMSTTTMAASCPRLAPVFKTLSEVAINNIRYFEDCSSDIGEKYSELFFSIQTNADSVQPLMVNLEKLAPLYDFDSQTPANGYRSLIYITEQCLLQLIGTSQYVSVNREAMFFRANHYLRELSAFSEVLHRLKDILVLSEKMANLTSHDGSLFIHDERFAESLMSELEAMPRSCFYGRTLGYQYVPSIRQTMDFVCSAMAAFIDTFRKTGECLTPTTSLLASGKYMIDPTYRGELMAQFSLDCDVTVCKAFWSLSEQGIMQHMPGIVCNSVQVNKIIMIEPEPFQLPRSDASGTVTITPPVAHVGPKPVQTRLISFQLREGQEERGMFSKQEMPKSNGLVIHCHGGGFVAQSSKSHEMYLRSWARDIGVPILSVDYSLAPELPFPRALEEIFFAYCWALNNSHKLGTTAENICFAGDSAGGNLIIAVAMRAAAYGVRLPNGLMAAYPPTFCQFVPSPSRILSIMDILLPFGILSECLIAYSGIPASDKKMMKALMKEDEETGDEAAAGGGRNPGADWTRDWGERDRRAIDDDTVVLSDDGRLDDHDDDDYMGRENFDNFENTRLACMDEADTSCDPPVSEEQDPPSFSHTPLVDVAEPRRAPKPRRNGETKHPPTKTPRDPVSPSTNSSTLYRQFSNLSVVRNPYLSPLLADDELLKDLPPVHIVACALDPILDDSIMFAKRLRSVGVDVQLNIIQDLPHGFLNFTILSKATKDASNLCVAHIVNILYGPYLDHNIEISSSVENLDAEVD